MSLPGDLHDRSESEMQGLGDRTGRRRSLTSLDSNRYLETPLTRGPVPIKESYRARAELPGRESPSRANRGSTGALPPQMAPERMGHGLGMINDQLWADV